MIYLKFKIKKNQSTELNFKRFNNIKTQTANKGQMQTKSPSIF